MPILSWAEHKKHRVHYCWVDRKTFQLLAWLDFDLQLSSLKLGHWDNKSLHFTVISSSDFGNFLEIFTIKKKLSAKIKSA